MKKLKYNIRANIIRFLLKICTFLKGQCYCGNEFYYETNYVRIKDIKNNWKSNTFNNISMKELLEDNIKAPHKLGTWKELLDSIKTEGIKVNPKIIKSYYGYEIIDGNHRIKILDYLYGGEYKVKVDIYLNHKKLIPYYTTMGIVDEVEHIKTIFKQNMKETKNKIYESK